MPGTWTPSAALEAARKAGPCPFPEFVARCVAPGDLTTELFDALCDAWDRARAERDIAAALDGVALPEEPTR